jgi:hypothetical protein
MLGAAHVSRVDPLHPLRATPCHAPGWECVPGILAANVAGVRVRRDESQGLALRSRRSRRTFAARSSFGASSARDSSDNVHRPTARCCPPHLRANPQLVRVQLNALRVRCDRTKCWASLEHLVLSRSERTNLPPMVHHRDTSNTGGFRRLCDTGRVDANFTSPPVQVKAAMFEPSSIGLLPCTFS